MSAHSVTLPSAPNLYSSAPVATAKAWKYSALLNSVSPNGFEEAIPGLMSFQNVTLPSAPNLYSSEPLRPIARKYATLIGSSFDGLLRPGVVCATYSPHSHRGDGSAVQ